MARLRREVAEKDRLIRQLTEELAHVRAQARAVTPTPQTPGPSPPPRPGPPEIAGRQPTRAGPGVGPLGRSDVARVAPARGVGRSSSSGGGPAADPARPGMFDNLSFFLGLEGSKQPQDFGVNATVGGRFAGDWGLPLLRDQGLGLQVGHAITFADNAVQVFERINGNRSRTQYFTTVGVFQRTSVGLNWGVGYDFLTQSSFDTFNLGQWRAIFGYQLTRRDEVGVRLALSGFRDTGLFFNRASTPHATAVILDPISQGTLFWRHTFASRGQTTFWAGVAEGHGQPNAALGDQPPVDRPFVFGAELDVPLNDRLSLSGQANFIRPADTGTVDAFLGFVFTPVARAQGMRSARFAPVQRVASGATFSVDLSRRLQRSDRR